MTNDVEMCLLFWKRTAKGLNATGLGVAVSIWFGSPGHLKAPCFEGNLGRSTLVGDIN